MWADVARKQLLFALAEHLLYAWYCFREHVADLLSHSWCQYQVPQT